MSLFIPFIEIFQTHYLLIGSFFIISIIYSSVGFGGGSSYLALLSLTGLAFIEFRAISLICNIIVVSVGTFLYAKNGFLNWKKVIPLVFLSIPMAFLGGYLKIDKHIFLILLGITLVLASVLMLVKKNKVKGLKYGPIKTSIIGGIIGFISGMVGIGGGVFLSPILHLTNWSSVKNIAAASSFFILVNSISGLIGQMQNTDFQFNYYLTITLAFSVFIGAQIGSRVSIKILVPKTIKILTSLLIAYVGVRLLVYNLLS
jgi:uncharacterized membrane protein YfcA